LVYVEIFFLHPPSAWTTPLTKISEWART